MLIRDERLCPVQVWPDSAPYCIGVIIIRIKIIALIVKSVATWDAPATR